MKKLLSTLICVIGMITISNSQCDTYQIYESFTSTLPTQGGTWTSNSMIAVTTPVRTGTHAIGFNGAGDWVRIPQIANPGVLSFWYRRSSNTTAWTLNVQTSPDGTTWTTRGTVTAPTATYQQYTLNIGALGLTNVFIRLIDARGSGAHERYVEDLSLTSTVTSNNILIPFLASCSYTLNTGQIYNVSDNGGPAGPMRTGYANNVNRTITITPAESNKKVSLQFFQMDLETGYDSLYVYDGPTTSSPVILATTGTTIPSLITSSAANGELTLKWITDVSNVGAWGGFLFEASIVTALPVELTQFEAVGHPQWNVVKWATASEQNSDYFSLESSIDGETWREIAKRSAAGNSIQNIKYSWIDYTQKELTYYRLVQFDIDGKFKIYGPIIVKKSSTNKTIVKYINLMGQEINPLTTTGLVIEVFDDGSIRKVIR